LLQLAAANPCFVAARIAVGQYLHLQPFGKSGPRLVERSSRCLSRRKGLRKGRVNRRSCRCARRFSREHILSFLFDVEEISELESQRAGVGGDPCPDELLLIGREIANGTAESFAPAWMLTCSPECASRSPLISALSDLQAHGPGRLRNLTGKRRGGREGLKFPHGTQYSRGGQVVFEEIDPTFSMPPASEDSPNRENRGRIDF
jgi:hypothetical protein